MILAIIMEIHKRLQTTSLHLLKIHNYLMKFKGVLTLIH